MVTKSEQTQLQQVSHQTFDNLRTSLQTQSQNNIAHLKQSLDQLLQEVSQLDLIMKEQVQRAHGNLILDMNLERGRMKEEIKELEEKLEAVKKSVDTEVLGVVEKVGEIQNDLKKSISRKFVAFY